MPTFVLSFPWKRESRREYEDLYGTLYTGVTNNLERRMYEHKNDLIRGFTAKYHIHQLVYYEQLNDINIALQREKQLKKWNRKWKLELIEKINPSWKDLADNWIPDQVGDDSFKQKLSKNH